LLRSRENTKWLTMSMGHKITIADLITPTPAKVERREEPEMRGMKSSKSEKRIHYGFDEPTTPTLKQSFSKNKYVLECIERSSKKIVDKKEEEKEKAHPYVPPFGNKSCKLIKEDLVRPKIEKTASYHNPHEAEPLERLPMKKHLTVEPARSYHHIDTHPPPSPSPSKHKLSIHDF
jgi:hypothetical protein